MHGVFSFFCRDAGLHLGAGYRSDPTGARAVTCLFFTYMCYMIHALKKVLWMSAVLVV